ncbi:MAG: hypothetical protein GXX79_01175 [Actinomycetales bacterium]|nr:hypothetical protein [Actinomycetales bacterium]
MIPICLVVIAGMTASLAGACSSGTSATSASPHPASATARSQLTNTPVTLADGGPAAQILSWTGYRGLTLGMTWDQAVATGMVHGSPPEACMPVRGADKARHVWFGDDMRVVAIDVGPGVRTTEGVRIGDSWNTVKRAYPQLKESDLRDTGRMYARHPGREDDERYGGYRFSFVDGEKLAEITLESHAQNCYE